MHGLAHHDAAANKLLNRLSSLLDWRHSLLFTLVAGSAASVVLISALLFFAIDHLVSQQFESVRAERVAQAGEQVRATVARELDALSNLGGLLGNDTELNNATYYHLFLDGEIEHPAAAVQRIAKNFRLDAVRLLYPSGRLITAAPASDLLFPSPSENAGMKKQVAWVNDQPWLAVSQPITRDGNLMAQLWLGRPLSSVLTQVFPPGSEISVRITDAQAPVSGIRLELAEDTVQPVWLDVSVDDKVGSALAAVKRLLLIVLPFAGLFLTLLLGLVLRRQLRPLNALTQAVAAVGRGEFARIEEARGKNEIAQLVNAFNAMSVDLAKLRELERVAQQQERLSAIGRMAARVAHDINNPLSVVRGVAELMEKQAARTNDAQSMDDSRLILHHIERCQRTVEQLLSYGRPVRLHAERHDLNVLCAEMSGRWQRQNPSAVLKLTPAEEALPVAVDTLQLERVIDNLLDNARDAAPAGGIELHLGQSDGMAVLQVLDTGPGFSEEARAHLFEPFHTTKRGGSGLGLASCLSIVRALGGDMSVGNGPGGEVIVKLPLSETQGKTA